jgi:hypothetical protein
MFVAGGSQLVALGQIGSNLCEALSTRRAGNLCRFSQPITDFACTADRIQDFGADAIAPSQIAAFRLVKQRAEIAGHRG